MQHPASPITVEYIPDEKGISKLTVLCHGKPLPNQCDVSVHSHNEEGYDRVSVDFHLSPGNLQAGIGQSTSSQDA